MSLKSLATASVALLLIAPLAANAEKPTPVTVVDPVVPVEVTNADSIPVKVEKSTTTLDELYGNTFSTGTVQQEIDSSIALGVAHLLTSVIVQVVAGGTSGTCKAGLAIGGRILFSGIAPAGTSTISPLITLPSVEIPEDAKYRMIGFNETGALCTVSVSIGGLRN